MALMTLDGTQSAAQSGTFNRQPQNPPAHLLVPVRTFRFRFNKQYPSGRVLQKLGFVPNICSFISDREKFYWGSDPSVAAHILGGWSTQRPAGAARVALFNL